MDVRTRLSLVALVLIVGIAPTGAGAKLKKKTVATIYPAGVALAPDPAGVPHVAYQSPDHRPYHAALVGSKWLNELVDDASDAGWDPALGVDSLGRVHFAYHAERMVPSYAPSLVYALLDGGSWQVEEVDDGGYLTSLALDADNQAHLLYQGAGGALGYAQQEDVGWEFHATGLSADVRPTHLALDAAGKAHACYIRNGGAFGADAFYASDVSGDWVETPLGANGGHLCSLALDGDGHPVVAVFSPQRIALFRSDGMSFSEEVLFDFALLLPGVGIGPDGLALALDAAGRPALVVTLFASLGGRGGEAQLFFAFDGEEWRAASLGTKDEGFDPSLVFGPDGRLHGVWRSGGEDRAKLTYFLATFPDLAGSWSGVTLLPAAVAGTLTVENQGTEKSKSVPVALYRSDDPVWDIADLPIEAKLKVGSVKPGGLRSLEFEVQTYAVGSGDYLIAVIDPDKQLDDLDRSDNTVAALIP